MSNRGFGGPLRRLIDHQKYDLAELARMAGFAQVELEQALDDVPPSQSFVRQLAPALDLHTPDLFVIAQMAVPDDLMPLDASAGGETTRLVGLAMRLPLGYGDQLRQYVRSLPQHSRVKPIPAPKSYEQYPPGPGAMLVRMLANRNLNWTTAAKMLFRLANITWSSSTVGAMGRGDMELTSDLLTAFARVLGIPAQDLAALAGAEPPETTPEPDPKIVCLADLLWEARRLTFAQVQEASSKARAMLWPDI